MAMAEKNEKLTQPLGRLGTKFGTSYLAKNLG